MNISGDLEIYEEWKQEIRKSGCKKLPKWRVSQYCARRYGRHDDAADALSYMKTGTEYITMQFAALDPHSGQRCADNSKTITCINAETDDKSRRSICL